MKCHIVCRATAAFVAVVTAGILCSTSFATAVSPGITWSRVDGTPAVDNAAGVGLDNQGSVYVAGWTTGAFTAAPNAGSSDVYVAKYASNGLRHWVKQFGSSASDIAIASSTDGAGNTYVFGNTYGNFDGSTPQSVGDVFLVKLSKDGSEAWRRQFGSAEFDQAGGLALDNSGNVYVVGSTEGAMAGSPKLGETDVFFSKFSSNGTRAWTKQFGTTNFDFGFGIAVDLWGTIAIVGETQGQFPNMRETGITDAYVASFAPDGTARWLRQENSGPDFAYNRFSSVVMDDFENIIVGGYTGGSYSENTTVSGETDAVVISYNRYAQRQWVRQFGTTSLDSIVSMSRAPSGNLFFTGSTEGRTFGYFGATGATDVLMGSITSNGQITWVGQYGTANADELAAIDADAKGNVFAAGFTSGALTPALVTKGEDAVMVKWSGFAPAVAPRNTIAVGKTASRPTVAALARLTVPLGSAVKLTVPSAYRTKCAVMGSSVKGLRRGTCRVTVSVTTKFGVKRTGTATLTVK